MPFFLCDIEEHDNGKNLVVYALRAYKTPEGHIGEVGNITEGLNQEGFTCKDIGNGTNVDSISVRHKPGYNVIITGPKQIMLDKFLCEPRFDKEDLEKFNLKKYLVK